MSQPPDNLGLVNGRLPECPASPNCVSTQAPTALHQMPAIPFTGAAADAINKLKQVIADSFSQADLIEEKERYLRYEFRTFLFRFVDDVEFLVDDDKQLIHFRSASRVGYSDMGTNRRRMTTITEEFKR